MLFRLAPVALTGAALVGACLTLPATAMAGTMTFDFAPGGFSFVPYAEGGAVFSQDAGAMFFQASGGNPGGYFDAPNFQGAVQTYRMADNSQFDLGSIDLKIWAGLIPKEEVFVGTLAGGGTVTATFSVPADFQWRTYQFDSSWTGLTSVSTSWNLVAMDNIVSSPTDVPEPASAALLSLAVLGLTGLRRRG